MNMIEVITEAYEDIYSYFKEYVKSNSIYSPAITKQAPEELNISPLIILRQYDTYLTDSTLRKGNKEKKNRIVLEVEIYSTDIIKDDKKIAKQKVINELIALVDDVLGDYYNLNLDSSKTIPNIDTNINRHRMQYSSVIDINKKLYRR